MTQQIEVLDALPGSGKTYADCKNAKQKLLHEKWQEMQSGPNGVASLQKNITFPSCLRVVFEDVTYIDHLKEEKKGSGE